MLSSGQLLLGTFCKQPDFLNRELQGTVLNHWQLELVRRLGVGPLEFSVSGLEELVDGDGFLAGAGPAGADATHEGAAVLASLDAQEPGVSLRAVVNDAHPAEPG